jgi:septum formation protein
MKRLILASQSSTRRALLQAAGVDFAAIPADLDEAALTASLLAGGRDAGAIALSLAEQKALKVSRANPGDLVLGGDSVLALGDALIGKSPDLESLRSVLQRLSGKTHELISAAALAKEGRLVWQHVVHSRLVMRALSDGFIESYLAHEGEGLLGSVGGYRLEGLGAQLFESIEGDYFSVLGLPLLPLLKELRALGWLAT